MNTVREKERIITALRQSLCVVKDACEICGISRGTFYSWVESDLDFKLKVDEIREESIDFVESKLFSRVNGYTHDSEKIFLSKSEHPIHVPIKVHYPPSEALIQFYLKTRGKKRGYIEKIQYEDTTHEDNSLILQNLTQEELNTLTKLQIRMNEIKKEIGLGQ